MTPALSWPLKTRAKDLMVQVGDRVTAKTDPVSLAMLYGVPRKVRP